MKIWSAATRHTPGLIASLGCLALVLYIALANLTPFGAEAHLQSGNGKEISSLTPARRVQVSKDKLNPSTSIMGDYVYFTSKMAFAFEQALVKVRFKNPSPDQEVRLGYKDQTGWHYATQAISAPFMDRLAWPKTGEGPYLYQKEPRYPDLNAFLRDLPKDKVIGVYDYDAPALQNPPLTIPGYQPAPADTTIATPLRGKVTMYMYLNNESFKLALTKRDLNWYADPDTTTITIYKDEAAVMRQAIPDDGNVTDNRAYGAPQSMELKNPGPGLPENGVYKVVIDQPSDSVITSLTTNLHQVVFQGPLYPVENNQVYPGLVPASRPTMLYTNALALTMRTDHTESLQTSTVDKRPVPLQQVGAQAIYRQSAPLASLVLPKSDAVVSGVGYFSFTPQAFFLPTPYSVLPIRGSADIALADYILTTYTPPTPFGGDWLTVERAYDLTAAVTDQKKLSWVLELPGLADNQRTIEIGEITMDLIKSGRFQ